jgi:hypothetical protein
MKKSAVKNKKNTPTGKYGDITELFSMGLKNKVEKDTKKDVDTSNNLNNQKIEEKKEIIPQPKKNQKKSNPRGVTRKANEM